MWLFATAVRRVWSGGLDFWRDPTETFVEMEDAGFMC